MQYAALARNYDQWMRQDQPIEAWVDSIRSILDARGIAPGARIADLACGTGGVTLPLAQAGYRMIGVDLSEEMLSLARDKAAELGYHTLPWVCQDMARLDIPGRYQAILCCCDGVNYLTDPQDVQRMFAAVSARLEPGGVFIFDVSTPAKLAPLAGQQYALDSDEGAYIWHNTDEGDGVIRMEITLFLPRADGAFERSEEVHRQRAHSQKELSAWLKEAGFSDITFREAFTGDKPQKTSRRWQICAQIKKTRR